MNLNLRKQKHFHVRIVFVEHFSSLCENTMERSHVYLLLAEILLPIAPFKYNVQLIMQNQKKKSRFGEFDT